MTQEIPYRTSSYNLAPSDRAKAASTARPEAPKRSGSWFVEALHNLARAIVARRFEDVPESLIDDVGLRTHATSRELHSGFNRLDAQLYARFY